MSTQNETRGEENLSDPQDDDDEARSSEARAAVKIRGQFTPQTTQSLGPIRFFPPLYFRFTAMATKHTRHRGEMGLTGKRKRRRRRKGATAIMAYERWVGDREKGASETSGAHQKMSNWERRRGGKDVKSNR